MKQILLKTMMLMLMLMVGMGVWAEEETIYSETFGSNTTASTIAWTSAGNYFSDTKTSTYCSSTNWKVSKNTSVVCDVDGTSGNSHLFSQATNDVFILKVGSLSGYSSATLSLNWKNGASTKNNRTITIQVSSDGGSTWGSDLIGANKSQNWQTLNYVISGAYLANFAIKITNTSTNDSRIDDIKIVGTPKSDDGDDGDDGDEPSDPQVQPADVNITFGYSAWGKSAAFSGNTYDEVEQTVSNVTCTYKRNSGSLYANTTSLRLYKTNELTFDAPEGYLISGITFKCSAYQSDITSNVGTCTSTNDALSWSGKATSVTFTRPSTASSYATISDAAVVLTKCAVINVSSAGYATFVAPFALDFSKAEITAYAVEPNLAEEKVTLTSVDEVPAGKAIVVKGAQGNHNIPAIASADDFDTALEVSENTTDYNAEYTYYYLGVDNGTVGFRPLAAGGSIAAGKCFFKVGASASPRWFSIADEETAIKSISTLENGAIYNMAGQRVGNDYKGIVIKNGKKYLNK